MKTIYITFFFLLLVNAGFAQTIPNDSLYLGQFVPGDIPEVFQLQVSLEHFAAERITISNDGREIFYSEIKSYYPINSARIKYYRFTGGKWTGPFVLFEDFCSPALSVTGDTMYFENGTAATYFSIKNGVKWSDPKRILSKLETAHYLQVTNIGNHYISSKPVETIGISDWCKLNFTASDTTAVGLGTPLNTAWDNLDFFVSRDESFLIVTTPFGLSISYPKNDGNWTNPRNLGAKINFGLGMWGPYVTPDNKYLFYTTGTRPDYSDVNVYWVRVDGLIDSLKNTNIPPYAKNKIKSQNGFVGDLFSYTIPGNTFFDEDGDTSLNYSVTLINGDPLPSWLNFNDQTKAFSGTPTEAGELKIIVTATDTGNDAGIGVFKLLITTSKEYLKEVLNNLNKIESATYNSIGENWNPGDTAASHINYSFVKEYNNPSDTTIGAKFIVLNLNDTSMAEFCYDGQMRAIFYNDEKRIVIDSFIVRPLPFRPLTPPFFNYAKSIIRYAIETDDSISIDIKDLQDSVYFKLSIFEQNQVEFFGKAYHMPLSQYTYGDNTSIYELWINKSTNLPYKIRREMSHNISVTSCKNIELNKLDIKDFKASGYFPFDYNIQSYGIGGDNIKKNDLIGKHAPVWTLQTAEKLQISLTDLKSKVVMIQFTSISCGPCKASIPFLKELGKIYKKFDFDFVAIESSSNNINALKNYMNQNDFEYKFLLSTKEVLKSYSITSFPVFFILDKDRVIKKVINGYRNGTTDGEILKAINELIR